MQLEIKYATCQMCWLMVDAMLPKQHTSFPP